MEIQLIANQIIQFLEQLGFAGLFGALFLEGASVPFPGIIAVLAYGGLLDLSLGNIAAIGAMMAFVYSIASLIPYYIGNKLEHLLGNRIRDGLKKAGCLFTRYGVWSIALSRPFGIGNYISYLAGIGRVGIGQYLFLTYIGIFPWCFSVLFLGDYVNGNYERFREIFEQYKVGFYGTGLLLAVLFTSYSVKKHQKSG